jgi:dTDP-4-amino-4,6-dideoxygalactose transaminase
MSGPAKLGVAAQWSPIPLVDLKAQYECYQPEFDEAVRKLLSESVFIGGQDHDAFADEFAAWCGGGFVALVGNGTDALTLAITEILGPGDGKGEIVTSSHSFVATAEAIVNAGYGPVFADIDPKTCLMDLPIVESAITAATRALLPVHLYGQMLDLCALREIADRYGLAIIEDAAQAHGAAFDGVRPGELSEAACFSFYPGKNLGAWGDGGAVFSKDTDLARRIRRRANHGRSGKYLHEILGVNSRLDTLQAVILRVKLRHLADWNDARRRVARWYDELLADEPRVSLPVTDPRAEHVFHLYVVQLDDRDRVRQRLNAAGIGTGLHYPIPIHEQPAFAELGYAPEDLLCTNRAAKRVLSLPIYPEITREQVERVASKLREAVQA